MKKALFAIAIFAILTGSAYAAWEYMEQKNLEGPAAPEAVELEDLLEEKKSEEELPRVQASDDLPASLNIEMPFYSQAPHGNWDYPWQEACEEASVLLVANVYQKLNLNREAFNDELLRLVEWEIETFGAYEHTSVAQTAEMVEVNYGLETVVHENPSFEDFQEILAKGHFIIAPFAGQHLGNPNYQNGGPVYHMVVVKGYDAEKMQIVTHDVGTRNGADYVYSWETVAYALHDWHDRDILLGEARILEVLP